MKTRRTSLTALTVIIAATFVACSGNKTSSEGVKLQGAGASFPAPLYQKWFKSYGASHDGVQIDYQSIGSGGGVKSVIDKTVDFGASDAAMSDEDMAKVDGGVQLLPMTAGCIVLTYNLKGVTGLKLSAPPMLESSWAKSRSGTIRSSRKITPEWRFPTNPSTLWSAPMEVAQPSYSPNTSAPSVLNSARIPASTNFPIGPQARVPRATKG